MNEWQSQEEPLQPQDTEEVAKKGLKESLEAKETNLSTLNKPKETNTEEILPKEGKQGKDRN